MNSGSCLFHHGYIFHALLTKGINSYNIDFHPISAHICSYIPHMFL